MKVFIIALLTFAGLESQAQETDCVVHKKKKLELCHAVSLGYLFEGNNSQVDGRFTGEIMTGVEFGLLGASLGIAVDEYAGYTAMPFFIQAHINLRNGATVPYYYTKFGWSKVWDKQDDLYYDKPTGGVLLGAGIGLKRKFNDMALNFGIGYQMQRMSTSNTGQQYWDFIRPYGGGTNTTIKRTMNRVALKVGVLF